MTKDEFETLKNIEKKILIELNLNYKLSFLVECRVKYRRKVWLQFWLNIIYNILLKEVKGSNLVKPSQISIMFSRLNIHLAKRVDGQRHGRQVQLLCPLEKLPTFILAHLVDRNLLQNQG